MHSDVVNNYFNTWTNDVDGSPFVLCYDLALIIKWEVQK